MDDSTRTSIAAHRMKVCTSLAQGFLTRLLFFRDGVGVVNENSIQYCVAKTCHGVGSVVFFFIRFLLFNIFPFIIIAELMC